MRAMFVRLCKPTRILSGGNTNAVMNCLDGLNGAKSGGTSPHRGARVALWT